MGAGVSVSVRNVGQTLDTVSENRIAVRFHSYIKQMHSWRFYNIMWFKYSNSIYFTKIEI